MGFMVVVPVGEKAERSVDFFSRLSFAMRSSIALGVAPGGLGVREGREIGGKREGRLVEGKGTVPSYMLARAARLASLVSRGRSWRRSYRLPVLVRGFPMLWWDL